MDIQLKRVYESPEESDGYRILTDRLWPRGISREKAALDLWAKDMAPSSELRKWFGHDPENMRHSGKSICRSWIIIRERRISFPW